MLMFQFLLSPGRIISRRIVWKQQTFTIPKKSGKKKAKASEVDSDVEIISRIEITFEDTKAITRVDQEFKWGKIYQMIRDQNIPDASLEDMSLYENIRKSDITKAATCPDLLPCVEVIGWILP